MRIICAVLIALALPGGALAQGGGGQTLVMWVALGGRARLNKILPGSVLEGRLLRSVYWRDTELFPKGSAVRLVVDRVERRKPACAADGRPFVIRLFAPRREVVARFRSASVSVPGGGPVALRAAFISLAQRAELAAPAKPAASAGDSREGHGRRTLKPAQRHSRAPWVLTLQVEPDGTTFSALAEARAARHGGAAERCPEPCSIAGGTRLPVVLLNSLSAAGSREGQSVQAVLLEPVRVGSSVAIPQGSVLEGVLVKSVPPRRLYRPGSLNLLFTRLALPNGAATAISASPVAAEVEKGSHMSMDSEGRIHAGSPGRARLLLDFGVSGGLSKVADDTTQLLIEAISSTATDASTAGAARFAALGVTGIYMLTRHGRDVILPPYTEMDVSLNRAVSLGSDPPASKPR